MATTPRARSAVPVVVTLILTLASLLALGTPAAQALPPANDNFANATTLNTSSGHITANNVGATGETGEPAHFNPPIQSVWFDWTAPANGTTEFRVCISNFDPSIGIYTGPAVDALTGTIGTNDDAGCGYLTFGAILIVPVTIGTEYHISVDGLGSAVGSFILSWGMQGTGPDTFPGDTLGSNGGDVTFNHAGATGEAGEPNHAATSLPLGSHWFTWTPPATVSTYFGVCNTDADTTLAVYTGAAVNALVAVASNNDTVEGCGDNATGSGLVFAANSANTYRIAVDTNGATAGSVFTLRWRPVTGASDAFPGQGIFGTSGSVTSSNVGLTGQAGEPDTAGASVPLESAWYTWTAPQTGLAMFHTCFSTFDTTIGIYRGAAVNALEVLPAGNNECAQFGTIVRLEAVQGTAYRIAVDGAGDDQGTFMLEWFQLLADSADLEAGVDDVPDTIAAGGTMTSTLRVRNLSQGVATDVTGTIQLPAQGVLVSVTPEQGSCGAPVDRKISCSFGSIDFPNPVETTVVIRMTHAGTYKIGLVGVDSAEADPVSNNNSSVDSTTVTSNTTAVPGVTCTIVGTGSGETLHGTAGPDTICLLGGADSSNAKGGADRIIGGSGADTLHGGGGGNDVVEGGDGPDTLDVKDGLAGDTAHGGGGTDTCKTDAGDTVTSCP